MAIVVAGGTLAILALAISQIAVPAAFGPGGLAAVAALDLSLFLAVRHRRLGRRVPPGYLLGIPERDRQRLAAERAHAEAKKIAGTVIVVLFVLGLYTAGWIVREEAMINGSGLGLYFLGAVMCLTGGCLIDVLFSDYFAWGWRAIQLESAED